MTYVYRSFDDYVVDYPEAEPLRVWFTGDGNPTLFFKSPYSRADLPGQMPGELPGGFIWAFIHTPKQSGLYNIMVQGSKDGMLIKRSIPADDIGIEFEAIAKIRHTNFTWFLEKGYEYVPGTH